MGATRTSVIRKEEIGEASGSAATDRLDAADSAYYYARVTQADAEMAWSSPVWINPEGE